MRKLIITGAVVLAAVALLTFGTVGVSLALENQDGFCASCHTEPESKYYAQSLEKSPATLAAFHTQKNTACIDCHSGGGILGRAQGFMQGTDDLMLYVSGNYKNPAITSNPLGDDSCLKCHANVLQQQPRRGVNRGSNGHYHQFLTRWQSTDVNAGHCITCHTAHPINPASQAFLNNGNVAKVCDNCHRVMGER